MFFVFPKILDSTKLYKSNSHTHTQTAPVCDNDQNVDGSCGVWCERKFF